MLTVPTLWLMVGLPAAGKTTAARRLQAEHDAIRVTPDDIILTMRDDLHVGDRRRTALEGALLDVLVPALRRGVDAVVDYGLWSREERTALRWVGRALGARVVVLAFDTDPATQLDRIRARTEGDPRLAMSEADLRDWAGVYTPPAADELDVDAPLDPPPPGHATWGAWAADRWPGLRVVGPR